MRATKHLAVVLALTFLVLAGCSEIGQFGLPGDYESISNDIVGEVRDIDTRAREIEIRANSGRTTRIRYDIDTQVIYRQRNYSVANLERGDYVAARVQQDRDGRNYTSTITVREAAQDRASIGGNRLDRIEGRIEYIDSRRGTFEIRDSRNRLTVVSVPFNAPRGVVDRFNRLKNGDEVRVEGYAVSSDRFDLESFL